MTGFLSRLGRFFRAREGAAALEFALVGPIHIALLMSIVETGLIMTKKTLLDHGAAEAAKLVYIGAVADEVQRTGDQKAVREALEGEVCRLISIFEPNCAENVSIEMVQITDFDDNPGDDLVCRDKLDEENLDPTVRFTPGTSSSVMFMRICLSTNVYVPGLSYGLNLDRTDTGKFQLVSIAAFANEPF